jgi:hypothetical protein
VTDPADRPLLPLPSAQLLLYRFGPEAEFEGRLVGALERIESGGTLRVLDAIFVHSDRETGALEAVVVHGDGAGRMVAPLLDFRLDASKRRRATERALGGDRGAAVRSLSAELDRGESWPSSSSSPSGRMRSRMPWRGRAAHRWRASSSSNRA